MTPSVTESELSTDGIFIGDWIAELPGIAVRAGALYVVSMPVGDMQDISIRALRVLKSVSVIAAENPTVTRAMMKRYRIETSVTGFQARGHESQIPGLIARLRDGATLALVCDAGTPLVADAGAILICAARAAGLPLTAVPGPAAALVAFAVSGSITTRFTFDGFPPRGRTERIAYFASLHTETRSILLYEARAFLRDTLKRLRDSLGAERAVLVARDLTKATESLYYGTLAEALHQFQQPPSGEFTLVVYGPPRP